MFNKVPDFVQNALQRKSAGSNASQAVLWGCVNSVILTIVFYDLKFEGYTQSSNWVWWCGVLICMVCTLNIWVHFKSYIVPVFILPPIEVNEKQRKLLSISDSDVGFRAPSPQENVLAPLPDRSPKLSELFEATIRTPPPQTLNSSNLVNSNKSWYSGTSPQGMYGSFRSSNNSLYSNTSLSPGLSLNHETTNPNSSASATANSWSFHRNQSSLLDSSYNVLSSPKRNVFDASQLSDSILGRNYPSPLHSLSNFLMQATSSPISPAVNQFSSKRQSITNREDLDNYLKEFHAKERKKQILSQNENGNGGSNSLWAYSSSGNPNNDFINALRQNVYQPATKDAGQETSSSGNKNEDAKMTSLSSSSVSKIWLKRNVKPKQLFQYEENLRIWLSKNILQPLVKLIDVCNEALAATAPELQIGNVGVDKLRKAAQNISCVKQLSYLLPFLDLTVHQDYLVQRFRELSRGGAISAFQWNAGGNFNGKPWREEFPTDSYILLHLFSMYMDNHLPPDPTQPDGRVFSNLHIVKTPEKPPSSANHPYLYLKQINPPHFKVILPVDEECDVGGGHKNFLHSLLLFCHHLVYQQHSHIAGVNLKLSGINLAWVLNAE